MNIESKAYNIHKNEQLSIIVFSFGQIEKWGVIKKYRPTWT